MHKPRVTQVNESRGIHVARDPHPVPARVQRTLDQVTKTASRETDEIKAKRPAA
jgi:hypothetical protein